MRWRLKIPAAIIFLLGAAAFLLQQNSKVDLTHLPHLWEGDGTPAGPRVKGPPRPVDSFVSPKLPPPQASSVEVHPVRQLAKEATKDFESRVRRQSTTVQEAAKEYRRRHGIPPPPNFDKWYDFAKSRNVVFIDEYDSIFKSLLPFWAVPPHVIRSRARESLGYNNFLIDILIRDGVVTTEAEGWQQRATVNMLSGFTQWLPDMDLAFNTHDEPRVILSQTDLSRLIDSAEKKLESLRSRAASFSKHWSPRPTDIDYTKRIPECPTTRFNRFARQSTWAQSRLSCPPDSAARSLDENPADDPGDSEFSDLHLIFNKTSSSNVCNMPSLKKSFGLFDGPNAYDIVQDLFPVFSQSKVSTYQDILYPSPWYWANKVKYDQDKAIKWDDKISKLYWRGGTTGGYAKAGGWRRQHRQQLVHNINGHDLVRVFQRSPDGTIWDLKEAPRDDYADLFSVNFSMITQCEKSDCRAQKSFFDMAPYADQADAWRYKYLLDVDGNAFSGRFYSFMSSFSAVFKASIFREWHDEDGWIQPWVHYFPMSLRGHEYAEVLRYLDREDEGRSLAKEMADRSREWAQKALRNEDLEVWFFRLLLEYGRLVDDNRDDLGFEIPV